MTDEQSSPKWSSLSAFRSEWKTITAAAALSSGAALGEAAGLVLIIALAETLGSGPGGAIEPEIGPISASLTFNQGAILAAALILGAALARVFDTSILARRRTNLTREWRNELIQGFMSAGFERSSNIRPGTVIESVGQQAKLGASVFQWLSSMLNSAFSMVILVGAAFALDPLTATILIIGGGLLLLAIRPASKKARTLGTTDAELDTSIGNQVAEMVSVVRDIKLFGGDHHFEESIDDLAADAAEVQRRLIIYNAIVPVAFQTAGLLVMLLALVILAATVTVNLATVAAAALLLYRGLSYGQTMSRYQQLIARTLPYVDRVLNQHAAYQESVETFGRAQLEEVESVEFSTVSYSYADADTPAIEGVSFAIKQPGLTGFIGPSGSGKSTVAQLMLRLRQPSEGQVLINGTDINEFRPEHWRRAVAFVPQEAVILHGSVHDNIAFFRDWVTREEVERSAASVGLLEHIRSLPAGFDTPIGPTIRDFSGGQKQRIGIARALVGNPSLVVLDEPTSALDSESEDWVMETLGSLRGDRIVIVITHRASTREHCDSVLEFDDGHVIRSD